MIAAFARCGYKFKLKASTRKVMMREFVSRVTFSSSAQPMPLSCAAESAQSSSSQGEVIDADSHVQPTACSSTLTAVNEKDACDNPEVERDFADAFLLGCPNLIEKVNISSRHRGVYTCPAPNCSTMLPLKQSMLKHVNTEHLFKR